MRLRVLCLVLALASAPLAGCLSPTDDGPQGALGFDTIDRGPESGIEAEETTVVREEADWTDLWDRHKPDEDRPEVDFEQRMLLAIFKGESPDGCHGAEIENVTGEGDRIRVEGAFFEVTDAYCTQQITYPFHIVAVERHDAEVVFDVREETRQQGGGSNDTGEEPDPGEASYTCRETGEGGDVLTEAGDVGFETLDEGSQSGIEDTCLTVAWNETAWRDLWRDHHGASTADEERPEVDFEENVVAAIFKGQSPDACHGAEIENVTRDGVDLVVHGAFYEIEGASCAEVVTYPFHIVATERPTGEVRFDVREETRQG